MSLNISMVSASSPETESGAIQNSSQAEPMLPEKSQRKGRSKRNIIIPIVVTLAVVALVWLVHWWMVGRFIESTDDAYLQADSVTVAPKVSGYVSEVLVGDNQWVNVGQPLVRLNNDHYQTSVDQAQANILASEADITQAQAEIVRQQAAIEQAEAQQRSAMVQERYADHEFKRYQPLAASGAEADEHLAELRSSRDRALADDEANVAAVKAATAQIATMRAQIEQAKAKSASSNASLRAAQLDFDDTVIRSPLDGRVGDRTVRVGQYVQPGTRLLTVVPMQDVYLVANFKETQIGNMRAGQPVTLHVDALSDTDFHGVVDSFAPGTGSQFALLPSENSTGNFTKIVQRVPVRIRLQGDDAAARESLLPGMSVTADVDTRPKAHGAHHG